MSRIRTIKPEWLEDEIALESSDTRVASIGLILLADDHGRGRANETILGSAIFPGSHAKIRETLARLSRLGFIALYEVRGQRYYQILSWDRHQRVDRPGKPRVPCPCSEFHTSSECPAKIREGHANPRESLATDHDHDHDHDHDQEQESAGEPVAPPSPTATRKRAARSSAPAVPGYTETVAHFDRRYTAAHGGSRPTWGAKQGKLLSSLLKAHGPEEVRRRIDVLFDAAPPWLDGRDVGTLAQHFDKLAKPNGGRPDPIGDFYREACEMEAAELAARQTPQEPRGATKAPPGEQRAIPGLLAAGGPPRRDP